MKRGIFFILFGIFIIFSINSCLAHEKNHTLRLYDVMSNPDYKLTTINLDNLDYRIYPGENISFENFKLNLLDSKPAAFAGNDEWATFNIEFNKTLNMGEQWNFSINSQKHTLYFERQDLDATYITMIVTYDGETKNIEMGRTYLLNGLNIWLNNYHSHYPAFVNDNTVVWANFLVWFPKNLSYEEEYNFSIQTNLNETTLGGCTGECNSVGERDCFDSTHYRVCGNFDDDSCLEWGTSHICSIGPNGRVCSGNGECESYPDQCIDECDINDQRMCFNSTHYRVCGNYDEDNCLEWGVPNICPITTIGSICNGNGECEKDNPVPPLPVKECEIIGLRQKGKYCSSNYKWIVQKKDGLRCENNFECTNNICLEKLCGNKNISVKTDYTLYYFSAIIAILIIIIIWVIIRRR